MEMRCTPVSAMARTVSRVMPPEASSSARSAGDPHRLAHLVRAHVVEQDHGRAGGERLAQLVEVFHLDLDPDAGRREFARLRRAPPDAAGRRDVVFLDQDARRTGPCGDWRRRRCAPRISAPRAGRAGSCACPRSSPGCRRRHPRSVRVAVATADSSLQEIERAALGGEQCARLAPKVQTRVPACDCAPFCNQPLRSPTAGSSLRKQASNQGCPQTTASCRHITVARAGLPAEVSGAVASPSPTSSARAAATLRSISDAKSIELLIVVGSGRGDSAVCRTGCSTS